MLLCGQPHCTASRRMHCTASLRCRFAAIVAAGNGSTTVYQIPKNRWYGSLHRSCCVGSYVLSRTSAAPPRAPPPASRRGPGRALAPGRCRSRSLRRGRRSTERLQASAAACSRSSVFLAAAADDVDRVELAIPGSSGQPAPSDSEAPRSRARSAPRRPAPPGAGCRVAAIIGDGGRHVRRQDERRVMSGLTMLDKRLRCLRHLHQRDVVVRAPGALPDAAALLHEPQAHDVLEQPNRAADAALVGEVDGQGTLVGQRRPRISIAHQRPGAGLMYAPPIRLEQEPRRRQRRCRASPGADHRESTPPPPGSRRPAATARAPSPAAPANRGSSPGCRSGRIQVARPRSAFRIDHLTRGRVGVFIGLDARHPVVEQVGNEQHRLGSVKGRRAGRA